MIESSTNSVHKFHFFRLRAFVERGKTELKEKSKKKNLSFFQIDRFFFKLIFASRRKTISSLCFSQCSTLKLFANEIRQFFRKKIHQRTRRRTNSFFSISERSTNEMSICQDGFLETTLVSNKRKEERNSSCAFKQTTRKETKITQSNRNSCENYDALDRKRKTN